MMACSKSPEILDTDNNEDIRYYVKYEGYCVGEFVRMSSVSYVDDRGQEKKYIPEMANITRFTITVGPVQKGFQARITTEGGGSTHSIIYVSINEEPFCVKTSQVSSNSSTTRWTVGD